MLMWLVVYLNKRLHIAGTVPWVLMNIQTIDIRQRQEGKMTNGGQEVFVHGEPFQLGKAHKCLDGNTLNLALSQLQLHKFSQTKKEIGINSRFLNVFFMTEQQLTETAS